ncbi:MAG: PorT family protein [Bacteroidetes bacterium]|nr:PorT family protein [Bacteroidota bacterium]MBS1974736.1 PorT family protein [Bacteroidota bacterium]
MKHLFLLVAAATITTIATAQVQFGAKGGLNLANARISPKQADESYSFKPDFHAGLLANLPLAENLYLQPEVVYSGEGTKAKMASDGPDITAKINFGMLNIPVLFQYRTASGFFAEVGPQAGILLSAKAKMSENGVTVSSDIKDQMKSFNLSGVVGIGYLSSLNLGIDARFSYGFLDIHKSQGSGDNTSIKTETIQIGVFYLLGAGKSKK